MASNLQFVIVEYSDGVKAPYLVISNNDGTMNTIECEIRLMDASQTSMQFNSRKDGQYDIDNSSKELRIESHNHPVKITPLTSINQIHELNNV